MLNNNDRDKLNEGIFGSIKKFSDSFFDGLKMGAINTALEKAKKNKKIPNQLVQRMEEIDKLSKELEEYLKKYE